MADDAEHDQGVVDRKWQEWVAENLVQGASADELVAALVEDSVPPSLARACVRAIADSPAFAQARRLARRVAALEQMVRLRTELRAARAAGSTMIERRAMPDADDFLARHWVPGTPAVFTDLVPRWRAFGRWGPADFVARFGDVRVEACVGRIASAHPEIEWDRLRAELTMRELVVRIESGAANDVYLTTHNKALCRPELRALLDDIAVPPEIFGPALLPEKMGLWFGASGTHTAMHHDHANSMLCQVVGRKRFRLAPPESIAMLDRSRGVFNHWDPAGPLDDPPQALLEVELAPGEALFIPTGWWHQVDALDVAISVSIRAFAWPNDDSWYRPGTALAGRRSSGA